MTDTFIFSRIQETSTFRVGPYRVPKVILPKKPGPSLDLLASRQAQIIRNQGNPNSQGFEIFLATNPDLPEVLRELPVIPEKGSPRNFYLLDYFFPSLGLAIELDSKTYHTKSKDREKTNDLRSLGIEVLRVYGFWDPVQRKDLSERIRGEIMRRKERRTPFPLDYRTRIVSDFRVTHRKALEILERLPLSGIDPNLYVLDPEEEEVCSEALKLLSMSRNTG